MLILINKNFIIYFKQGLINDNTSNVTVTTISTGNETDEHNSNEIKTIAITPTPNVETPMNEIKVKFVKKVKNDSAQRNDNNGKQEVR